MSWAVSADGTNYALLSHELWLRVWVAIADQSTKVAFETLLAIKPPHWPIPGAAERGTPGAEESDRP